MEWRARPPSPALQGFVALLWHWEGAPRVHALERILPRGTFELIVNLHDDSARVYDPEDPRRCERLPGLLVVGAHSRFHVIDTEAQRAVLGVSFEAGGAFPFLGLPAGELQDRQVGLETLWGAAARGLRERLVEAQGAEARFRIVEEALLRFGRLRRRHPAVTCALREFQRVPHVRTVAQVTGMVGLSRRRFIEVFRNEVGLTPKVYCRLQRFREALGRIHRQASVDWADVAAAGGYADQSHFIRDFRAFSGLSPSAWLAARGEHINHVPIVEEGSISSKTSAAESPRLEA